MSSSVPELISTLCRLVREGRVSSEDYRSLKSAVQADLSDADLCGRSNMATAVEWWSRLNATSTTRSRVFDASPEGCKVEFVERPAIGERVWVRFDGIEPLEGTVRWVEGHVGGVKFKRPLHQAVFQRLTATKEA